MSEEFGCRVTATCTESVQLCELPHCCGFTYVTSIPAAEVWSELYAGRDGAWRKKIHLSEIATKA
jgi:hypothetical protein